MSDRRTKGRDPEVELALSAFRQRLRDAYQTSGARDIAQRCGLTPSTVQSILNDTEPRLSTLVRLAEGANVPLEWLASGLGEPVPDEAETSDTVSVPRYDVIVSAGNGAGDQDEDVLEMVPFPRSLFARMARRPDGMKIVLARGDSMMPTIADGDLVMIDTGDTVFADAIWAFNHQGDFLVKRLRRVGQDIEVRSENAEAYPPYLIADERSAHERLDGNAPPYPSLRLVGRVVWFGHTL